MKKLFFSALAVSVLMSACNQAAKTPKTADSSATQAVAASSAVVPAAIGDGAQMKFEFVTHDFGKITQGDKVTYKFNFTNTGKTPLIITSAVASCGCTTPTWPKGPIKPGDGGQIEVTFNSLGKMGLQDKMITITANTNPPQNVVHMIGEVLPKK